MTVRELERVTIHALRKGSVEAFNLCYDLYFSSLCSYANLIVHNHEIAEEIVQEIFVNIWIQKENLPVHTSLKAYLAKSVKNDCLDYLKHLKVKENYAEKYLRDFSEWYEDIFYDLINKDIQQSLDKAIEKLPPQCREVFTLSRFEYLSYREISEKLGISVKTVENQIGKALKIVREELDPHL
ncbi:MAG: RNA polymerase sigma-70 factor [Bacteroidales bacterium]